MELKEFVKDVIIQLTDGIVEAQREVKNKGCVINPQYAGKESATIEGIKQPLSLIDFEVLLTKNDESEVKTGIGVFFYSIGAKTQEKNVETLQYANRIKFSIPVVFPNVAGNNPLKKPKKGPNTMGFGEI